MKKLFISALSCLPLLQALAQQAPADPFTDSNRIVQLRTVQLQGRASNTQQKLVHFYKGNASFTLEDIMARLPEVSMQRRGPYGMEPAIRAFNGGQINLLIDGMRIYGACTDKMDPPTIYVEPVNLDHLQVNTAANGFIHGSSIGGSVLLTMAEPRQTDGGRVHASISSGYSSVSKGLYQSAKLHFGNDRWSFLANGTYRKNHDYRSGDGKIVPFSAMEKINYSFSAKYRLNEGASLKADFLGDDGWNIGYPALPMDVGYAAARMGSVSIQSERATRGWTSWNAKLYANRVKHYMDDTHRPNTPMHMDMPGRTRTYGAFAEGSRKTGQQQTLRLRADVSSTFLTASMTMYPPNEIPMYMLTWPDHRKMQSGLGASWTFDADSNWRFQANARVDYITHRLTSTDGKEEVAVLGYDTEGRDDLLKNLSLSATRKTGRSSALFLNLSYAERMPTGGELYGFYLFNAQDGYDYLGKADLQLENAKQAEIGVRGKLGSGYADRIGAAASNGRPSGEEALTTTPKKQFGFNFQLTAFASYLQNYITGVVEPGLSPMTIGANGVKSWQNLPWALQAGGEASLSGQLYKHWQAVATLRYVYARDDKGDPLPFIPPLKSMVSLRYQPGAFSAQAEWEAAARQDRYAIRAGEDETPGFMLLHLRLGYAFPVSRTTVALQSGIENLFDAFYHEHLDWGNIPRQGRNIYLQLNVSL